MHQFHGSNQNGYRSSSGFFANGPPPVPANPPPTSNIGMDHTDFVSTPPSNNPQSLRTMTAFSCRKSEMIVQNPANEVKSEFNRDNHSRTAYYNQVSVSGYGKPPFPSPNVTEAGCEPPAYAPPPIPSTEPSGGMTANTNNESKITTGKLFLKGQSEPTGGTRELATNGRGQSGLYLKCNLNLPNEEDLIENDIKSKNSMNLLNVSMTTGQQKVSDWRKNLNNTSTSNGRYNQSYSNSRSYQSPMAKRNFETNRSAFEPSQQYSITERNVPRDDQHGRESHSNRVRSTINTFQRSNEPTQTHRDDQKYAYNSFETATNSLDTNSIDSDRLSLLSSNGHGGSEDMSIEHEELDEDRSSGINSRAGSDLTKSDPDIPTSDYLTDDLDDTNDHDLSLCSDLTDTTNESVSDLGVKGLSLDYGK